MADKDGQNDGDDPFGGTNTGIANAPPVSFASPAEATFYRGEFGRFNIALSGKVIAENSGPVRCKCEGTLPHGISFAEINEGNYTLSGTPTKAGTTKLALTASVSTPVFSASQAFTLTVKN
jgi:hypothetical protein